MTGPNLNRRKTPDASRMREWEDDAACKQGDPEVFVGSNRADEARAFCLGSESRPPCPVREACLEHALAANEVFGIWGGLTRGERVRLKRQRARP